MRRISAWAITHPVFPLVLFAVLTAFGIVAFVRMPITLNPDVSAPFVHVLIGVPGAAPTEIETQVLTKVEGSVSKVSNVKNIISRATEGQAMTFVEFQIGTPVDRATTDVRDAVARIRGELPPAPPEATATGATFTCSPVRRNAPATATTRSLPLSPLSTSRPSERAPTTVIARRSTRSLLPTMSA